MINYATILVPLYFYPAPGAWDPLFLAASKNPLVTFQAIINPNNGPGGGTTSCPDANYINATAFLNSIPNIKSLAYTHTANRYNCGADGNDICPCTNDIQNIKNDIQTYQNWPTNMCSPNNAKDIHVDGIFFDEAPTDKSCFSYMQQAVTFAKNTLTRGNTVLFNAGAQADYSYFSIADFINVFEGPELSPSGTTSGYYDANIAALDNNGAYAQQSTIIIHNYTTGTATEKTDVNTILNYNNDAIGGLYITDLGGTTPQGADIMYSKFPTNWSAFVADVAAVAAANKKSSGNKVKREAEETQKDRIRALPRVMRRAPPGY